MKRLFIASAFMAILCSASNAAYLKNFGPEKPIHTITHTQKKPIHTSAPKKNIPQPGAVEQMVSRAAAAAGVPVQLALKIAHHESRFQCGAVGAAGERGVMQIKPSTARGIGYKGPVSGLNNCETGITWGMKYLKMALIAAKGNAQLAAFKYNAGLGAKSRNYHKKRYVLAVAG